MTTELDLRLAYRSDTGKNPTYGYFKHGFFKTCNYKGALTNEYAMWLERLYDKPQAITDIRLQYTFDTGKHALKNSEDQIYTRLYKKWLEDLRLEEANNY